MTFIHSKIVRTLRGDRDSNASRLKHLCTRRSGGADPEHLHILSTAVKTQTDRNPRCRWLVQIINAKSIASASLSRTAEDCTCRERVEMIPVHDALAFRERFESEQNRRQGLLVACSFPN